MGNRILFHFKGKKYAALAHLSLQAEGCYIFSFLEDPDLVAEFGADIDIHTDCVEVLPDQTTNNDVTILKKAILDAVKELPEFQAYMVLRTKTAQ